MYVSISLAFRSRIWLSFPSCRLRKSHSDMVHQLSNVSLSMVSSRRSQPIPQDFAFALWKQKLSLSSLEPHLRLSIPPSISQPFLPTPPPEDPPNLPLSPVLGSALSGALDKQNAHY